MSTLLLPISLFIKQYIDLPVSYLKELPIYLYIIMIFMSILFGAKIKYKKLFNTKIFICTLIVLGFQLLAMLISYVEIGNDSLNIHPIKQFLKLCIFVACIFIHYIVVSLLVNNEKNIQRFIRGNQIALYIVLTIVYIQLFYLISPSIFTGFVSLIGNFEYRWERMWYTEGSYVQTIQRVNGLNPEASYLAAQLLIVFVPFILASIKNKVNIFSINRKYNARFFYLLLISIIVILFFARSTMGIMAIVLIVGFFWISLPIKRKITTAVLLIIIGIIGFIYIQNNSYMMEILNENLFDKTSSGSAMNRSGGTIALIITWLEHFLVGIGWEYHNYFLLENVPSWSTANAEYQYVFAVENFYPILSVIFGWLAQFGTISCLFIFIYSYKLLKDYRLLSQKAKSYEVNKINTKLIDAIKDSAHYFVAFYLSSAFFVFHWSESMYLIMFFFFVVVRQMLKKELDKESSRREY